MNNAINTDGLLELMKEFRHLFCHQKFVKEAYKGTSKRNLDSETKYRVSDHCVRVIEWLLSLHFYFCSSNSM